MERSHRLSNLRLTQAVNQLGNFMFGVLPNAAFPLQITIPIPKP